MILPALLYNLKKYSFPQRYQIPVCAGAGQYLHQRRRYHVPGGYLHHFFEFEQNRICNMYDRFVQKINLIEEKIAGMD
jgi:hypothetical protein